MRRNYENLRVGPKTGKVNTATAFEPFYQCLILHSFLPKILKIFSLLIYYTTKPAFK